MKLLKLDIQCFKGLKSFTIEPNGQYGREAPIFIDNSESLTFDLGLTCQQIFLRADPDVDELTVEINNQPETDGELF